LTLAIVPAAQAAGTLSLTITGTGSGAVTSAGGGTATPEQLNCSYDGLIQSGACSAFFSGSGFEGQVRLTATPAAGSLFTGWIAGAGGCTGTTNPCFVSDTEPSLTAQFELLADPPEVEIDPVEHNAAPPCTTGIASAGACFSGKVNPEGSVVEACDFEVIPLSDPEGFASAATEELPCEPDPAGIGDGSNPVPVRATAEDLEPNTAYRVRLAAAKQGAPTVTASESFQTTAAAPSLLSVSVAPAANTASLYAGINPNNEATSYRFEYGLTEAYGHSIPVPDGSVGSGFGEVTVVAYIEGLSPETEYHYRVVAGNAAGSAAAPDHTFTTEASVPSRAYELVSTGAKNDADALTRPLTETHSIGFLNFGLVSASGNRAEWDDRGAVPSPEPTNGTRNNYVATRGPASGWSLSAPIASPGAGGNIEFLIKAADAELSAFAVQPSTYNAATGELEGSHKLLYRDAGGSFATIFEQEGEAGAEADAVQLSPDGSHVFFDTGGHLLPGDTHAGGVVGILEEYEGAEQVYEWTPTGGLRLAGVDSGGEQTSPCGATLAGMGGRRHGLSRHDVSDDGSRVFFQSPDPGMVFALPEECKFGGPDGTSYVSDLYLREGDTTIDISKPPAGVPDYGARFVEASPDGSQVFFVTETALTPDKTTEGPGHADLYRYDTETNQLTRLSVGAAGHDDAGLSSGGLDADQSSALASADGSTAYFTALGQLVPGEGDDRAENEAANTLNLYRWAEGNGVSFLATIKAAGAVGAFGRREGQAAPPLASQTAAVTPDGSDLLFGSRSHLTGYDNEGAAELYRYDAPSGSFVCPTCAPAGAPPGGSRNPVLRTSFDGGVEGHTSSFTANLGGLSADGSTVVFASTDRLLPAAVNTNSVRTEPVFDIYAWHDGTLSLISTGTNPSTDFLLGSSASGKDVFFATTSQLVPADRDGAYDVYDARVGGGFSPPPQPAPPCEGEGCKPSATAPPSEASPASSNFSGPGNPVPSPEKKKCLKSFVRKHGKCVKKNPKKRAANSKRGGSR
jgi:hypothetical protein